MTIFLHIINAIIILMTVSVTVSDKRLLDYSKIGIFAEQHGILLFQSGQKYIPFSYHTHKWDFLKELKTDCEQITKLHLENINDMATEALSLTLPMQSHNPFLPDIGHPGVSRKKRFLGIVLGGVSAVGSIWNRIDIQSLKKEVSFLRTHASTVDKELESFKIDLIDYDNKLRELFRFASSTTRVLRQLSKKIICNENTQEILTSYVMNNIVGGYSEYLRSVNAALIGSLTPDTLPYHQLVLLLKESTLLKDSLYEKVPTLAYELGSVIVDEISPQEGRFTGVIILPWLEDQSSYTVFSTHSVNYLVREGLHALIKVPELFVLDLDGTSVWVPDMMRCKEHMNLYICPEGEGIENNDMCSSGFLSGNFSGCHTVFRNWNYPVVVQTKLGVIVGSTNITGSILRIQGGKKIFTHSKVDLKNPQIFGSDIGDYLQLNDKLYSLRTQREDFESVRINASSLLHTDTQFISLDESPTWRESPVALDKLIIDNLQTAESWISPPMIILSILIFLFACWILVKWWRSRKVKDIKKMKDEQTQDVLLNVLTNRH